MTVPGQPLPPAPYGSAVTIEVFSHGIRVTRFTPQVQKALATFCRTVAGEWGLIKAPGRRGFVRGIKRVFAGAAKDRSFFHFHRNQLKDIVGRLQQAGVTTNEIHIVKYDLYTPVRPAFRYHDKRTPKDYQAPIIEYAVGPGKTKIVTLPPGQGKTFIALRAIKELGVRTFFCIQPKYQKKWIIDAKEAFDLKPGELITVKGSKQLKQLIALGKAGELDAQIIICSNKTFHMYLKDYESTSGNLKRTGYDCPPHEFYQTLGVGLKVVDEVHESFHLNFRQDVYTHVPMTLSLSGSLEPDDPFLKTMVRIVFPLNERISSKEKNDHTVAKALFYSIKDVDERTSYINPTLDMYSHIRFEQSIMKRKRLLAAYLGMVSDIFLNQYELRKQRGQKCLIFFATVEMVQLATDYLKRGFGHLNISRYVGGDDYEEMLESEVVVSTIKSCGTAIDIPNLFTVILTDALGSRQANLQVAGRLRELKNYPGTYPEFLYLVCQDIGKHVEYHNKKRQILSDSVRSHDVVYTRYVL